MTDQLHFSADHGVGKDAVRCRPADAEPVLEVTWQPAYAGPCPNEIRVSRNANRVTARARLVGLVDNAVLAIATWLDNRGRRP